MELEAIIALVVLLVLTLGGAIWHWFDNHEYLKTRPVKERVWKYIVYSILGAPYLIIRIIILLFSLKKSKE